MKRNSEIEILLRDSSIQKIEVSWGTSKSGVISILVEKNGILTTLVFLDVSSLVIIETEFYEYQISHVKCYTEDSGLSWLILDPYNETDLVDERDNFKIAYQKLQIK